MTLGIVGKGRLGTALSASLREAGHEVEGPVGRGEVPGADVVLLCVPDAEITTAAEAVAGRARLVGHTSGATPLAALRPAARAGAHVFGFHPLQTFAGTEAPALRGIGCAIAGSTPDALETARTLAESLGMVPFVLLDHKRAAYHAAASVASNFLVTLQAMAEEVARDATEQELREEWALERVQAGDSVRGTFPMAPERREEFEAWRAARAGR